MYKWSSQPLSTEHLTQLSCNLVFKPDAVPVLVRHSLRPGGGDGVAKIKERNEKETTPQFHLFAGRSATVVARKYVERNSGEESRKNRKEKKKRVEGE